MSATTLAPPVRIPTEALGRARDFRRRVQQEDRAFIACLNTILAPIRERKAKHPKTKIRSEQLAEIARRWRTEPPRRFRLSLSVAVHGRTGVIVERRLGIGNLEMLDDPDWTGVEQGVAVVGISLTADATGAHKKVGVIAAFSLHAIARRYQRGRGLADDAIMADMMRVALISPDKLPEGGGVKVPTDTVGGGWRGRVYRLREDGDRRMIAVRTWLAE